MENNIENARPELLQVAELVAREKGIDKNDVLEAMELAIARAGRSKYGPEYDVRAQIDRKTGAIALARYTEVVDEVENEFTQISLADAQKKDASLKVSLPPTVTIYLKTDP